MDPFILFEKDHQNIRGLLDKITAGPLEGRKEKLLAELRQSLHFHLHCEERFLFPGLLRLGRTGTPAAAAVKEHRQIREGLRKLQTLVDDRQWQANLQSLRGRIFEHLEEEEEDLYEDAREVFDETLVRSIAQQLRAAKRERLAAG
jgi:hemerythrin-like domain-containing protein